MARAQTPYAGLGEEAIARRKLLAAVDLAPPPGCPPALAALLAACLAREPSQRPSACLIAAQLHAQLSLFWSGS